MAFAGTSLTVLIVNYKVYGELRACLAALAADVVGAEAHVVVVDYESDRTALAEAMTAHPKAIAIPRDDNRGFAAGMNEAAARAQSEYLLLLNPDCRVTAGALETLGNYLELHRDVAAVGPRVISPDGSLQATGRRFPTAFTGLFGRASFFTRAFPSNPMSRRNLPSADTDRPIDVDWVAGTCVMIRSSAFRDVGGFDEAFFLYWEDADLCLRLRQRGANIAYVPAAVVEHGLGQSSDRARSRSLIAFHRSALHYYSKHHRGPTRVIALPFAAVALGTRLALKLAVAAVRPGR
jgi:GT2 family glycosyltransferase